MSSTGERSLNSRGQGIQDKLQLAVGALFVGIMIIYAGVRGHKVVTQLPATYRTTQAPRTISNAYLEKMFPKTRIPSPTYEFPAMTFCPPQPGSRISFVSCYRAATATKDSCAPAGIFYRNLTFEGSDLQCLTVNDLPGKALVATNQDDILEVRVNIDGVTEGDPEGAVVATHRQLGPNEPVMSEWGFDNFFGASAYTSTEIVGKKLYTIDSNGRWQETYETKASSIRYKMDPAKYDASKEFKPFVTVEFRYPKLEATYEKSFLVLDMNNWLGEVGGVACLLFFLQRAFTVVVGFLLKRSDSFAYTNLGKEYRNEGFAHY
ncbi:hypothetical protein PhCBS80983_g05903 [Powellomyces hirtus]|uniref:Uncharacterized protein n=1 Tax=Powellomyces hirtus TaxID=109895 RepID=A0A507DTB1_9FUNG|nr:hypothetical protein PhCBS80983_g05903 [Powellomyces hirtus]